MLALLSRSSMPRVSVHTASPFEIPCRPKVLVKQTKSKYIDDQVPHWITHFAKEAVG